MSVHPRIWTFRLMLPPQWGVRHRIPLPMRIALLLEGGDPLGGILTHGNCGEPRLQSVERRVEVEIGHAVKGIPANHENGRALRLQRRHDLVHDPIQVGAGHDAGHSAETLCLVRRRSHDRSASARGQTCGASPGRGAPRSSSATALPRSRVRPIWHRRRKSSRRRRRRARIRRRVHGR